VSGTEVYVTQTASQAALPWRWKLIAGLAWLIAIALLALVLAHWIWRWFGPAPSAIPIAAPSADFARRIADARLFGAGGAKPAAPAQSDAIADLRLLGVFSERDGRGYALFRAGARGPLLIAAGHDIASGVRLESVRPDGVTLSDNGERRTILLRSAPTAVEKPRPVVMASNARASSCGAPAGFTGPVIKLNAELLGGITGAPDAWKTLLEPSAGGLIVHDQSGAAGMLGLQNGDRIQSANGIALAIPDDIASTVLQPLTRSQPVWISGTRGGKPQQWLYVNAGACPG
jgi:hypothetical protein